MFRLALLVAVTSLGCELFKPVPPPVDAGTPEYRSARLAPSELPFALADDLPLGNVPTALNFGSAATEVGPQVGTSLIAAGRGLLTELVPDSLLAVAALPDRVVVVFPSAPDGELQVAQGGLDRPWTAQPLDTAQRLLRPQVGALDAVVDVDGSVLIAVRRRPFSLWLYRWRTDGTITRETVPAMPPRADLWSTSRCPDVRLDASAEGGVALAYLAGAQAGLLWRKPGAVDWTQHLTPPLPVPPGAAIDVGCVNRVVLDASGFPQLLTLVRLWERPPGDPVPFDPAQPGTSDPAWRPAGGLPIGLSGRKPPLLSKEGYVMLANGVLSRRAELSRAEASINLEHPWSPGSFAFDRHPGGLLVSGPNVSLDGSKVSVRYRVHDPKFDPAAPLPDLSFSFQVDSERVETPSGVVSVPNLKDLEPRSGVDHLTFDPCGTVEAWGAMRARLDLGRQYAKAPSVLSCLGAPVAPVFAQAPLIVDSTPAFAHGRRPYDVAVCTGGSRLAICQGGWEPLAAAPLPAEKEPRLVSTEPSAGELPATATSVRFVLSRAVEADEQVIAGFWDVTGVWGDQVPARVDGATVTVDFPRALQPGATYRVALRVLRPAERERAWLYLDGGAPAVRFTTAKSAQAIDERVTRRPFPCEGTRDDAGVCLLSERRRGLAGQSDDLGVNYDFEALPLGPPAVYDAQGARVVDAAAEVLPSGTTRITWGTTLARDAVYELRFPEGILTFLGTEWLPEDLVLRFQTTVTP